MSDKIYTIEEIKNTILPIAQSYGVARIYLFGSYARGDATEKSDIDLRVDKGTLRGMFALSGLRLDISEKLQKPVDLLTTGSLDAEFQSKIEGDEVLIYDRT